MVGPSLGRAGACWHELTGRAPGWGKAHVFQLKYRRSHPSRACTITPVHCRAAARLLRHPRVMPPWPAPWALLPPCGAAGRDRGTAGRGAGGAHVQVPALSYTLAPMLRHEAHTQGLITCYSTGSWARPCRPSATLQGSDGITTPQHAERCCRDGPITNPTSDMSVGLAYPHGTANQRRGVAVPAGPPP